MYQRISEFWLKELTSLNDNIWFQRLANGDIKLNHYKGFLRETYHHAGLNPQIQAYCTMFLKNNPRELIAKFFSHARSEIAHDLMALSDLENLGENKEEVVASNPLPATIAYNAYVLYQIQFRNPIGYLGYLFHLEHMPTVNGGEYLEQLRALGIPENALTFMEEHATVDVGHNKMMEDYVKELVMTEEDFQEVCYSIRVSVNLHGKMLVDAFENGEKIYK